MRRLTRVTLALLERRSRPNEETRQRMAEQSHLEAMREAIRGDLERARSRNPSIFERPAAPAAEIREEPAPEPPVVEPAPVIVAREPVAAEPDPEPVAAEPEPEPELAPEPAPEASPGEAEARRGFFSRVAFWR
jgi:hypothetical protein